jgi:hypothetical protein
VLRGLRGRQPVWFIFGLYEGCPSCYVETATPKAWYLGGDFEIYVGNEYVLIRLVHFRTMQRSFLLVRRGGGSEPRCVCCCVGGCVVWMTGLLAYVAFRLSFLYKPSIVWFFNLVSLINWIIICNAVFLSNQTAHIRLPSTQKEKNSDSYGKLKTRYLLCGGGWSFRNGF